MPRKPPPPRPVPVVWWDRPASTPYHQVYRAHSRKHKHVVYKVVNATAPRPDERSWSCQCPRFGFARTCDHIAAAQEYAWRRWWGRFWASSADHILDAAHSDYHRRNDAGELTPEMELAWEELGREFAVREERTA